MTAAQLLSALAEAANELHRIQKMKAVDALTVHAPAVLPIVLHLLESGKVWEPSSWPHGVLLIQRQLPVMVR